MYHRPIAISTTPRRRTKIVVRTKLSSAIGQIWLLLGVGLVFLYVGRDSLLSLWAGPFEPLLQWGRQGLLIVAILVLLAKGRWVFSAPGLVFIVLTLPGVLLSENFTQSMLKWAAWAALFALVGPVIQSNKARIFRQVSWNAFRWAFIPIAIASFGWYALSLPNLGRGAFTGIMMHSMQLGPIAAVASLFLAHRAILTRSRIFLLLSLLVLIPCMLAGSRSALLGLAAGALVMGVFAIAKEGLKKGITIILIVGTFTVLGFAFLEDVKDKQFLYKYTLVLEEKGLQNTRNTLWSARLSEFLASPIVGMGVGMGDVNTGAREWSGVVVDASGKVNIEPGSSYLAVLSMTGLSGLFGLCLVLASIFRRLRASKKIKMFDAELFEVLAIIAFFAVHMVAEGYILAVGSQFCLLFWLCLGRVHDLVSSWGNMNSSNHLAQRKTKNGAQCLR